mgnify:CR=1 FL=1
MKSKMKLDVGAIKDIALEHGEKAAFGIVAVVFLMLVYSAIQRESLDASKQPERLQEKVSQVRTHLTQAEFDPTAAGLAVVNYEDRAKIEPIDPGDYTLEFPVNPPVADKKAQREMPKMFPIEQLRAVGGFGVFAVTGGSAPPPAAAGDTGVRRAPKNIGGDENRYRPKPDSALADRAYVVITGLVPIRKEVQAYSRAFDGAMGEDKDRDQPVYEKLIVQRAEVNPAQPDKLDWADLPANDEFVSKWEGEMKEIVNSALVEPALTEPLGPLVTGRWDSAITHPNLHAGIESAALAADDADADKKRDRAARARNIGKPDGSKSASTGPVVGDYRLCRAFDFSAESGKKYRYRAKIVLRNPNHNVPPQFLAKPETSASETVETEWSNSTATLGVPDRFGVLTAGVGEKTRSYEPSAAVLATAIVPGQGIEAATEIEVWRGSVVNTARENVEAIDPRNDTIVTLDNVDFKTGIVVVDVYGGKPLTRRLLSGLTGPVEILIMDPQGNLLVRNEFADRNGVAARKTEEVPEKRETPVKDPIPRATPARSR